MGAWHLKHTAAGFALAAPLFLMSAGSGFSEAVIPSPAGQEPGAPASADPYPASYGVYAYDGTTWAPLYQGALGRSPQEIRQRSMLPVTASLIVYRQEFTDPVKSAALISVYDYRHLGEEPPKLVDTDVKPVTGHPEMLLIVPKTPFAPGLYSVTIGKKEADYCFGIETPSEEQFWSSVLETNPNNWQAHNHLGAILYMRGDIKDAYPHFLKATQLKPKNPESHNNLALALSYFGKNDEAIKEYETAVQLHDDSAMDTNLANAYTVAKRYDDAIKTYRHAIELNPSNASAHCNLGYALMQQGKLDDAIEEFKTTIKIDPAMPQGKQDLQQALDMKLKKIQGSAGDAIPSASVRPRDGLLVVKGCNKMSIGTDHLSCAST